MSRSWTPDLWRRISMRSKLGRHIKVVTRRYPCDVIIEWGRKENLGRRGTYYMTGNQVMWTPPAICVAIYDVKAFEDKACTKRAVV